MAILDITPDPRILEVITHNPMLPINALCELIDNAIDGFALANESGNSIQNPTIDIELPKKADIDSGIGSLIIRDNGPGLSKDAANNAIRAGFSGNDSIGRLGLFGMGFNISTGKLGKQTILRSARRQDPDLQIITIDIPKLVRGGKFNVPLKSEKKPTQDFAGVQIEISDWWEAGTQNYNFIKKLTRIGVPKLTQQVGRRYSSLLRKGITIRINGKKCPIFRHCSWGSNRYVERKGHGRIPARYDFSEVLKVEKRCYSCGNLVNKDHEICHHCGEADKIKSRESKIKGWVGIQRFDDENRFGLDFIRNGRAILIDEKEAVFSWVPEATGERIKEYPVDGIYGRIIGEVYIDHVPTDFLKTDFQRTSPEWMDVIKFLRGESSLLPETQKRHREPTNESFIYKLFQGYRRVRIPGRTHMYMGYWDVSKNGPTRVSRELEKELFQKFLNNEPGYGPKDDTEWWKHVEAADIRPAPEMKECPNQECQAQNLKESEICSVCGYIFSPKKCLNCKKDILLSANKCPHCDAIQTPKEEQQWVCSDCLRRNPPEAFKCRRCDLPRVVEDNLKFEFLKENSKFISALSQKGFSISLPNNVSMSSLNIVVSYVPRDIILKRNEQRIPSMVFNDANDMNIFIDQTHPMFNRFQVRQEDVISLEVAEWIRQNHRGKITQETRPLWSLSNLVYQIHSQIWRTRVELDPIEVSKEVQTFFQLINESLPDLFKDDAHTIFENFDENEKSEIMEGIIKGGQIDNLNHLIENGEYLCYLPVNMIVQLFSDYPARFFDGKFWNEVYSDLIIPDSTTLERVRKEVAGKYKRCLQDMYSFIQYGNPDKFYILKINHTLRMVRETMVYDAQVEW